jgi:hypothetical protein
VHDIQFLFNSTLNNPFQFDQELVGILLKFEMDIIENLRYFLKKFIGE